MIKRFKVFTDSHLFSILRIFLVYLFKQSKILETKIQSEFQSVWKTKRISDLRWRRPAGRCEPLWPRRGWRSADHAHKSANPWGLCHSWGSCAHCWEQRTTGSFVPSHSLVLSDKYKCCKQWQFDFSCTSKDLCRYKVKKKYKVKMLKNQLK